MTFSALVLGSCSRRGLLLLLPARQRRCQGCSLQTVRQWDGGTGPRGVVGSELQGQRGCVPPVGLPQAPRDRCMRGGALWPSAHELLGGKTFLSFSRNVLCGQLVAF